MAMYSRFYKSSIDDFFFGKSFGGRLALVRIGRTNHFGPTNYQKKTLQKFLRCGIRRMEPEASYRVQRLAQKDAVRTIAKVLSVSLRESLKGKGFTKLKVLESNPKFSIAKVKVQ